MPFPGQLKQEDLHGEESELEGEAGCFEPLASEPHAGDPHDDDPLGLTPNISAACSMSELDSRNLLDRRFAKLANVWPLLDWFGS